MRFFFSSEWLLTDLCQDINHFCLRSGNIYVNIAYHFLSLTTRYFCYFSDFFTLISKKDRGNFRIVCFWPALSSQSSLDSKYVCHFFFQAFVVQLLICNLKLFGFPHFFDLFEVRWAGTYGFQPEWLTSSSHTILYSTAPAGLRGSYYKQSYF